jgi:hypothetical protein
MPPDHRPRASDVPQHERGPVADQLVAILRALPPAELPLDRAARRDVRALVRSLRRSKSRP